MSTNVSCDSNSTILRCFSGFCNKIGINIQTLDKILREEQNINDFYTNCVKYTTSQVAYVTSKQPM